MERAPRVVAIVGVTAGGKTAVGEEVAAVLDGEVVCADSRQVYRELEIGTGKPTPDQRAARPHHLFDALSLEFQAAGAAGKEHGNRTAGRASAGWYADAARGTFIDIHARGRVPVLVGGSGLYLNAARRGLAPTPPSDPEIRRRLQVELEVAGPEALHARLVLLDPSTAARLGPRDRQRITRALEVLESTGHPLSWWHAQQVEPSVAGAWQVFELVVASATLRRRIEARTRWMYQNGLVEETRELIGRGLGEPLARLRAVGYDEAAAILAGGLGPREAEARTCLRTLQLAKRQRTWFRHQMVAVPLATDAQAPADLARRVLAEIARSG